MHQSQRRGPWVPEEDQALLRLVNSQGPNNWVRISQHMKHRTPKQCRERFHQNLKPTLNHDPITAEEGLMIERMVEEMGKRWAEIARRLGNRSDNAVKNWWNGSVNRKRRGLVISCAGSAAGGAARTFHGRIEPPYTRSSSTSPVHLPSSFRDHTARSPRSLDFYSQGRDYSASATSLPRYDYSASTSHRNWAQQRPQSNSPVITSRGRQLTPLFTHAHNPSMQMDTSMTSPSFSEISNPASIGRPPSMVSDHNSIASSSPRTVNSPAGLAVPMEIQQQQHSYEERRRGSAPLVIPSIFNNSSKANNGQLHSMFDNHTPNHTYSSQHQGSDMTSDMYKKDRDLLDHAHPSTFQPHMKHQYSNSAPLNQLPPILNQTRSQPSQMQSQPTPTRDSRMGLETLLN